MDCVKVDMGKVGSWQAANVDLATWSWQSSNVDLGNMELTIQQCETLQFSKAKLMKSSWNKIAKYSSNVDFMDFRKLGLEESMKWTWQNTPANGIP
jgi:hypothetical protein